MGDLNNEINLKGMNKHNRIKASGNGVDIQLCKLIFQNMITK